MRNFLRGFRIFVCSGSKYGSSQLRATAFDRFSPPLTTIGRYHSNASRTDAGGARHGVYGDPTFYQPNVMDALSTELSLGDWRRCVRMKHQTAVDTIAYKRERALQCVGLKSGPWSGRFPDAH